MAAVLAAAVAGPVSAERLLLRGGWVVDPAAAAPRRADVLIDGDRIVAVGRVRAPRDARVVDVTGRFLAPGLWDMHAHVAAIGPTGEALEDYVRHGVLGIRDMGGREAEVFTLKQAVANGRLGPFMAIAGPTLNGEQAADFQLLVRDRAEGAAAVRRLAAAGADVVKVHRATSREALTGVLAEAKRAGLPVGGHVPLSVGWIDAAALGMRTFEHVQTIVENEVDRTQSDQIKATFEALERIEGQRGRVIFAAMAKHGVYWTPTLVFYGSSWANDPPERAKLKQGIYDRLAPLVRRAKDLGVPILAGTDALTSRGAAMRDELRRLVAAGLTPREVLASATTAPYRLLGKGPGPIRAGGEASLLVLRSNPLERIEAVAEIDAIVLRGKPLEPDLTPWSAAGSAPHMPSPPSPPRH